MRGLLYTPMNWRWLVPRGGAREQLQIVAAVAIGEHRGAHGCIGKVVMLVAGMVDNVVAAAGDVTLKAHELSEQAIVLGQRDAAGIEQRQRVAVKVGLGLLGSLIADAATLECLGREAAGPFVAHNLAD